MKKIFKFLLRKGGEKPGHHPHESAIWILAPPPPQFISEAVLQISSIYLFCGPISPAFAWTPELV